MQSVLKNGFSKNASLDHQGICEIQKENGCFSSFLKKMYEVPLASAEIINKRVTDFLSGTAVRRDECDAVLARQS